MMKKDALLENLADEYRNVEQSQHFRKVKEIRNNLVHNKSSTYFGMDVEKFGNGIYASGNSQGLSTEITYNTICKLLKGYELLCAKTNDFIKTRIDAAMLGS